MILLCPCGNHFDTTETRYPRQIVCNTCVSWLLDPETCSGAPCWHNWSRSNVVELRPA